MTLDPGDPDATFVGRDAELEALAVALARARGGHGRLVAVTGDAGIGKSRLLEEFLRTAPLPADRILRCRCPERPGAPSYWPWTRVLRAHADAVGIAALRADLAEDAAALAPLLPALAGAAPSTAGARELEARYQLFAAATSLLRRTAAAEPLAVAIEDVHWADEASLALLEFAAQQLDGSRILILITCRDRERGRRPRPLVDLLRNAQRIALQGLDRSAVAAIVARSTGEPVSDATAERLTRATGGNPFFLTEILRTVDPGGGLGDPAAPPSAIALPDTVRESIRLHLEPLAEGDRELLACAAVIGEEFDVPVLQHAAGVDPRTVLQRLHGAIDRGLVAERMGGRFSFAHALVRETIYGDLLPATRVHLHARVGGALEKLHGGGDGAPLGALASHFLHAAPLGTARKAVSYATRAAQQAMAVYAWDDALASYDQALAAISADPADPADRAQRLTLRLAAADAARRGGRDARARELLLQAARDARARGDRDALFVVAVGYYVLRPNVAEPDPETIPLLEEALRAAAEGEGTARATLLALLAAARFAVDGSEADAALGARAVEMARRVGDPRVLATALLARQVVVVGPDSTRERLALADEALALAAAEAHGVEHLARGARAQCFLELGEVAAAAAEVARMARDADRLRQPDRQWQVTVRRASIALLEGRFDEGAALASQALAIRRAAADALSLQVFVLQMFLARRDTGAHGGLEGSLRFMVEHYPQARFWPCVLAVCLCDLGRAEEAREAFEMLAMNGFARLRSAPNYAPMLCWLARVCTFLWDERRAAELYPLLLPYAEQNVVLGPDSQACLGSAHRYLGLLASALGDLERAEAHYRAGIAMNERMRARPVVACTQHEYARLLAHRNRPGDRTLARELIERARATSLACGMSQLLEWMERLGAVEPEPGSDVAAAAVPRATPVAATATAAAATPVAATAAGRAVEIAILRRDGDVWQIGLGGEVRRMKDARGAHLLSILLRNPGREVHALDLAAGGPGASTSAVVDRGDAGPLLDPAARSAYKRRLEDLRDDLEEAERFSDPERAARARREIDFLGAELARGVGLGGRDRRAASGAERARVNATRTIGGVIRRIGELSPRLGEHLRATVRTGYLCVYAPDPTTPIRWEL